ncbi:MAG: PIN domain-containing protein [Acidimicrobiia bacterium]|nr:PIN domain-containing protein [Acidimicrobiia bacterium]
MSGAVLDTGALVAFERNDRRVIAIIARAFEHRDPLVVPAGVVAQAWRNGQRQARLARLLGSPVVEVVPLDDRTARSVGQLCGVSGSADIVDASVVLAARRRAFRIVTSDVDDIRRLDSRLEVVAI